jgi:peroxiredoxin Q/BCP
MATQKGTKKRAKKSVKARRTRHATNAKKQASKKLVKKKGIQRASVSPRKTPSVMVRSPRVASMPKVGTIAPAISLPDQDGKIRTLEEVRGKWLLLYFYPKDDTPGCTKEACMIRDGFPFFEKIGAIVYGVSVDSVASHKKFAQKYQLPFRVLSDEKKAAVTAYGVWGEKKFMGRKYMGTNRVSFLIAPDGTIAKVYPKVDPVTHADEVLRDLSELRRA